MANNKSMGATHIVLLTRIFDISEGDVLEIGTGFFSTMLLHWLSMVFKRYVYSCENQSRWYNRFKRLEDENPLHHIELYDNWDDLNFGDKYWGLVFIDHGPAERRIEDIKKFADKCDYMVIHDTEPEGEGAYHYSEIWPLFKYRYDYKKFGSWATVVSNKYDLSNI